jgi:hypothetical protein
MGLKFDKDFAEKLELRLRQIGERAVDGVVDEMRKGAKDIQQLAKDYAPYADVAHGGSPNSRQHLQSAIEIKEEKDGRRKSFRVFVNGNRIGNDGKLIGTYALLMHEFMAPGEPDIYQPSESTQAKPGAGGKYLARAYKETYKKILKAAADRARNAFGRF